MGNIINGQGNKLKLKSLILTNFRNYEYFEIAFNKQLNVIVAENGIGKTTILDAIAIAYGEMLTRMPKIKGKSFEDKDLRIIDDKTNAPYMRIEVETYSSISWDRTQSVNKTKIIKNQIPQAKGIKELNNYIDELINKEYVNETAFDIPLIMYYGTSRAVVKTPMRKTNFQKKFSRFEALSGALDADTNFHRLFQWFDAMEDEERRLIQEKRDFDYKLPLLEAIRKAIVSMLPEFSNPRIKTRPLRFLIDKKIEENNITYNINQLSDGYKTVLAMIMDIAGRMAEANPDKLNPLESEAIIMIDEVDLHLHPRWQQTILIDLQNTFPNAQFIITTHSPQVLTTVHAENIQAIKLVDNTPIIKKYNFSYGAKSNELLKEILGINERPQNIDIVKDLNTYLELVNNNEYDTTIAYELRNKLNNWSKGNEKELLKADMDIRLKEYQKNK